MCAGAILQSRLARVVYGGRNELCGAAGSWVSLMPSSTDELEALRPVKTPRVGQAAAQTGSCSSYGSGAAACDAALTQQMREELSGHAGTAAGDGVSDEAGDGSEHEVAQATLARASRIEDCAADHAQNQAAAHSSCSSAQEGGNADCGDMRHSNVALRGSSGSGTPPGDLPWGVKRSRRVRKRLRRIAAAQAPGQGKQQLHALDPERQVIPRHPFHIEMQVTAGVCEDESTQLMRQFFRQRRRGEREHRFVWDSLLAD